MWNFDEPAPHERFVTVEQDGKWVVKKLPMRIIAAITGGPKGYMVVTTTWLPKDGRWEFMAKGEEPLAWMVYPEAPTAEIERRRAASEQAG